MVMVHMGSSELELGVPLRQQVPPGYGVKVRAYSESAAWFLADIYMPAGN